METVVRLNPRYGGIFAQSVHCEHMTESENAIQALQGRAEEAGWKFNRIKEVQTGIFLRDVEYSCVILTLTPPELKEASRRSRHSRFDDEALREVQEAAAEAASSSA